MTTNVKKVALAVATCSVLAFSAASQAADVHFTGAVTSVTCNLESVGANGAVTPEIQLGTIAPDETTNGAEVKFSLRPSATCAAKGADITWTSGSLTQAGIGNDGTAGGVHIELKPLSTSTGATIADGSAVKANDAIRSGFTTVRYGTTEATGANITAPFEYSAQLMRNAGEIQSAGTVSSTATYTVAYY